MSVPASRIRPAEPGFPPWSRALGPPLEQLRVLGRVPAEGPRVAIVGTRRADPEAVAFTIGLASDLTRAGVVVVSGGALGIDTAAHEGALEGGGPTVAVLPTGLAPVYPRANEALFSRIARSGAVVSEAEDGTPPVAFRFLRRNAVLAAIADAVVVVQAPIRSGALSTAAHAESLGKPVFAVPSVPWDPRGEGCLTLLRRGARICTKASDVLSVSAPDVRPPRGELGSRAEIQENFPDLDDDERKTLNALGVRPRHVDELARAAGLPVPRVQRALATLLLFGHVDAREGGRYVRTLRTAKR